MFDLCSTIISQNHKCSMYPGESIWYPFIYKDDEYKLKIRCVTGMIRNYSLRLDGECLGSSPTYEGLLFCVLEECGFFINSSM